LAENDFQDLEAWYPILRLREAGFHVDVVGRTGTGPDYKGRHGYPLRADCPVGEVIDVAYEIVIIPGGWAPDKLRMDPLVVQLVRRAHAAGAVVAAICHAPSLLVDAGVLRGRRVTSWPSIRADLEAAGALWQDAEAVVDGKLVTSRKPDDLPAFMRAVLAACVPPPA
jgi:protease I